MIKKYFISAVFIILFSGILHSQDGSITADIGGSSFRSAVKSINTETSYEINGGNDNEGIKILWNNISSASQVKTGTFEFPGAKDIMIGYVDFKNGKPFAVKTGTLTVTENDGKKISGTFSFTIFDGLPAELGGKEIIITNGKFTIHN
jgi:hypothetical protein